MNFPDGGVRGFRCTPFQLSLVYANQPKILVFVKANASGICMNKMADWLGTNIYTFRPILFVVYFMTM
jgi:hypothetical protein